MVNVKTFEKIEKEMLLKYDIENYENGGFKEALYNNLWDRLYFAANLCFTQYDVCDVLSKVTKGQIKDSFENAILYAKREFKIE